MELFIPIKHNSQRVPRKNFRRFGHEPLFKRTLLKFKQHNIFVDTDSQEVADLITSDKRLKHVTVFPRAEKLRGDSVSVCELIKDFILRNDFSKPLIQIHVTSPFLTEKTLKNAESFMGDYDSVVSCNAHNSRFWRKESYGFCPINHNPVKMEQTQDLPTIYEENSAFYIFKPEVILKYGSRVGQNPYFYPVSSTESIDIDTEDDWAFASVLKDVLK